MLDRNMVTREQPPPELTNDGVPFEQRKPRIPLVRRAARHFKRRREKPLSPAAIAVSILIYALGAATAGYFGSGLLLFAWLMAGPLAVTVYLTFDGHGSLLNPYTLFFAAIVAASVAAHVFQG
ncbi:MAG: hypothetical protein AB7E79_07625 [Rhodospirillaceae bacterium]